VDTCCVFSAVHALLVMGLFRLILHTKDMMATNRQHEKLCITVLQTLKEMVSVDVEFGLKVRVAACCFKCALSVV